MSNALKKIKVFAMDVDGVMTDGRIVYDADGRELKFFDVKDGYGIARVRKAGIKIAVISARSCEAVKARTRDLKFDKVYLNANPKIAAYEKMLKAFEVKDEDVCFIGDDLPDQEILTRVGFSVAPRDAAADIRKAVDFVTTHDGGRGAVRELAEKILKAQGKWNT